MRRADGHEVHNGHHLVLEFERILFCQPQCRDSSHPGGVTLHVTPLQHQPKKFWVSCGCGLLQYCHMPTKEKFVRSMRFKMELMYEYEGKR
ncbi:hypothetical protein E2C01_008035 [Portunus trituberculatus]|uniref:Uncharacterized protein n=1 Tax=Portunus trituberculatus TaxID=210409 RepID=A0A5B7D0K1_PORTR|nr:hypothetical protein [Portunus trituberculatus]